MFCCKRKHAFSRFLIWREWELGRILVCNLYLEKKTWNLVFFFVYWANMSTEIEYISKKTASFLMLISTDDRKSFILFDRQTFSFCCILYQSQWDGSWVKMEKLMTLLLFFICRVLLACKHFCIIVYKIYKEFSILPCVVKGQPVHICETLHKGPVSKGGHCHHKT